MCVDFADIIIQIILMSTSIHLVLCSKAYLAIKSAIRKPGDFVDIDCHTKGLLTSLL